MNIAITLLLASASAIAQTPAPKPVTSPAPKVTEIAVQSTNLETLLVRLAKQTQESQKTINDLNQQARTVLDQKNAPVVEKIKAKYKDWETRADADAKPLKDQFDANIKDAQADLQKRVEAVPQITSPATFKEIENEVKKEQNLPDNASFDPATQKWTVAETPKK